MGMKPRRKTQPKIDPAAAKGRDLANKIIDLVNGSETAVGLTAIAIAGVAISDSIGVERSFLANLMANVSGPNDE